MFRRTMAFGASPKFKKQSEWTHNK
jgi:hypothetical protein